MFNSAQRQIENGYIDYTLVENSFAEQGDVRNDPIFSYYDFNRGQRVSIDTKHVHKPSYKLYMYTNLTKDSGKNLYAMYPNGIVTPVPYNDNLFYGKNGHELEEMFSGKYKDLGDLRFTRTKGVIVIEYFSMADKKDAPSQVINDIIKYYENNDSLVYEILDHYSVREQFLIDDKYDSNTTYLNSGTDAIVRVIHFIPFDEINNNESVYYREIGITFTTRGLDNLVPGGSRFLRSNVRQEAEEHGLTVTLDIINNRLSDTDIPKEYFYLGPDRKVRSIMERKNTRSDSGAFFYYMENGKLIDVVGPISPNKFHEYGIADEKKKLYQPRVRTEEEYARDKVYAQNQKLEMEIDKIRLEMEQSNVEHRNTMAKLDKELTRIKAEKELLLAELRVDKCKLAVSLDEHKRNLEESKLNASLHFQKKLLEMKMYELESKFSLRQDMLKFEVAMERSHHDYVMDQMRREEDYAHEREMAKMGRERSTLDLIGKTISTLF